MLASAKEMVKEEGAGYLLAGLGPTVVGYGVEGAMKFGVYEGEKKRRPTLPSFTPFVLTRCFAPRTSLLLIALKPISQKIIDSKAVAFLVASVVAGAVAAVLLCPMESTRIRLVSDPKFGKGLLDGLPKLIREEGLMSTFDGLAAMLAKQVPYTLGKQVSFDVFAGLLYALAAKFGFEGSEMKVRSNAETLKRVAALFNAF